MALNAVDVSNNQVVVMSLPASEQKGWDRGMWVSIYSYPNGENMQHGCVRVEL